MALTKDTYTIGTGFSDGSNFLIFPRNTGAEYIYTSLVPTGLNADVIVKYFHGNTSDITEMSPITDLEDIPIEFTQSAINNSFNQIDTFFGDFGAIQIDELGAVTGTLAVDLISREFGLPRHFKVTGPDIILDDLSNKKKIILNTITCLLHDMLEQQIITNRHLKEILE